MSIRHGRHFDNRCVGYAAFPYGIPPLDIPMRAPEDKCFCEQPP